MAVAPPSEDLSSTQALVIEGNHAMRSILVSQLRDFGVKNVVQCGRIVDARRHLEYRAFDFVLCELHFPHESVSGQDLLNDLRRNQLLPFSTVFVMVTGEATYGKVAEAAESALDGYLLKPHKPSQLGERLQAARVRKISLSDIFSAIEAEDYETASQLCLERFETRGPYWLYAARVGAELLLRTGRHADAKRLYEAVIEAKTLPWAKLGVARSMVDGGQVTAAATFLENMINEDPSYVDAYDVMGRAQFELGNFDQALATYKMSCELTPASIGRLQNLGMMSFYAGERMEAEKILSRTCRLGLESRMFDCQTLVLLALVHFERDDAKAVQRCRLDFARLIEINPDEPRTRRLSAIVDALYLLQHHQIAAALQAVRDMFKSTRNAEFDFEAATNLLALLAQLGNKAIQLEEVEDVVYELGLRFSSSRALSRLLSGAAAAHEPYAERVRAANAQILAFAEHAMSQTLRGNPTKAVKELLHHGQNTLNAKLVETAHLVLDRHAAKIEKPAALAVKVEALRTLCNGSSARISLGEQKRQAGSLSLRTGRAPARAAAS